MKQTQLLSFLLLFIFVNGCNVASISSGGSNIPPPVLDNAPAQTNDDTVTLTGTKTPGTSVWFQLETQAAATELTQQDETTTWSVTLTLTEGDNKFVIFSTKDDGFSERVLGSMLLDSIAPATPTLNPQPTTPTGNSSVVLRGGRDADGDICLRIGPTSTCTQQAAIDGSTTYALPPQSLGAIGNKTTFCLSSKDAVGNQSDEICTIIKYAQGPSIIITSPTDKTDLGGDTVTMTATVTTGATPAEQITSVTFSICPSTPSCTAPATAAPQTASGTTWQAAGVDLTGLSPNSTYTITAIATNSEGVKTQDSVSGTFIGTSNVEVSNTITQEKSYQVDMIFESSKNTTHLVWADNCSDVETCYNPAPGGDALPASKNSPFDIFYKSYTGGIWSTVQLVSYSNPSTDAISSMPSLAVDIGGNLHVAWSETGDYSNELSGDNAANIAVRIRGKTQEWHTTAGAISIVDHSTTEDTHPALAAAIDGTVHLVWQRQTSSLDSDIFYSKWTPDSASATTGTWLTPIQVSSTGTGADNKNAQTPVIAVDSKSNAYIVWADAGNVRYDSSSSTNLTTNGTDFDILLRKITKAGIVEPIITVSDSGFEIPSTVTDQNKESKQPAIVMGQGADNKNILYIAWADTLEPTPNTPDNGLVDIMQRAYDTVQGKFVSNTYGVFSDQAATHARDPSIAADTNGNVVIAWSEDIVSLSSPPDINIFYRVRNSTQPATDTQKGTNTTGNSVGQKIVIGTDGALQIAWEDSINTDIDVFWNLVPANTNWAHIP